MDVTAHHRIGGGERRVLHAGLAVALLAIVVLAGMLVARSVDGPAADPFKARIDAATDCDALISEYRDHLAVYRITGSVTSKDEATYTHQRAVDVGC